MQPGLLPLFPLPLVLFPGTTLPLHIFEDRYKQLINEAIRDQSEFGIVLARQRAVLTTGCTAVVDRVLKHYEDGRMDIVVAGRRRFEISSLDQKRAFLRGEVSFFDDDDFEDAPADLREQALEDYKTLLIMGEEAPDPDWDAPQLSFQLANIVEDLDFRQSLLLLRSEAARVRAFVEFCREYIPNRRAIAELRRVQPTNGHSRLPRASSGLA
ncbi:MAG: LON peptidase substrate-binding domain-containing protein [bacterium]|jgi:Lon protease-like protein